MGNDTDLRDLFLELTWMRALDSRDPDEVRTRVAELLRSDCEITRAARERLANMFDGDAVTTYVIELKKRKTGRPRDLSNKAIEIWLFVDERTESGEKKEAAVREAMDRWHISRSAVFEALNKIQARIDADPENQRRVEQIRRRSRKRG